MAAATEEALAHPDAPLAADARAALGIGAALFVGGTGLALWRATGRLPIVRVALSVSTIPVVLAAGTVPVTALAILLAIVGATAAIEHRTPDRGHATE
jgi:hypothetical protein